ncbi:MAG: DUF4124 domain-containing protein [Gammaproteobacteria bacterium]
MMRHGILLVALLACMPLHAAIYKCTDAQGDTRYSDEPCGRNATVFVPKAAPAPAGDAAERMDKTRRLLRAYDVENAEREREETAARTARAEAEKNCVAARERLRNITRARALYRLDEDGNRAVLSFEERAAAEQQTRAAVEHWCE